MGEWAEGYDAGYATGTADGAKATNDFTKHRIAELETELREVASWYEKSGQALYCESWGRPVTMPHLARFINEKIPNE